MMNKKALLAFMAFCGHISACELTVVNNTPFRATVYDRRNKATTNLLSWQDAKIGKADERANITLWVFTLYGAQEKKYHLEQIACSKSHKIRLNVSEVLENNLGRNQSLFRVKKLKSNKS